MKTNRSPYMDSSKFLVANTRLKGKSLLYNSMLTNRANTEQNDNTLFIDEIFDEAEKEKTVKIHEEIPQNLRDLNQSGIA